MVDCEIDWYLVINYVVLSHPRKNLRKVFLM